MRESGQSSLKSTIHHTDSDQAGVAGQDVDQAGVAGQDVDQAADQAAEDSSDKPVASDAFARNCLDKCHNFLPVVLAGIDNLQ